MFTGLIEATGEVVSFTPAAQDAGTARLTVATRDRMGHSMVKRLRTGDSVAVNGVCLTALKIEVEAGSAWFSADLAAETIARTTLSRLGAGTVVNLELPTPAGTPLGGHVVQGHVDGVGMLVELSPVVADAQDSDWVLRVRVPKDLIRYVVEKGSLTVEGISLTVAGVNGNEVRIAILPHTYSATNLHTLNVGDELNLEVDVLAKYAESRGRGEQRKLTVEELIAGGY